jgi:hypothetical protein
MYSYCNKCAKKYNKKITFNICDIKEELKNGETRFILCHGCSLGGIAKENNEYYLANAKDGEWLPEKEYYEKDKRKP